MRQPGRRLPKIKEPIKLNLGCGTEKTEGWTGIDIKDMGDNIIWDLREGIPFPDESVEEVYSCHFLEHMDDDDSMELFREILRVLKKGKITRHRLPHQQDPTAYYFGHKTFWNEAKINALVRVPGLEDFEIIGNDKIGGELFFALRKRCQ